MKDVVRRIKRSVNVVMVSLKKMMRKDYNIRCVHLGHDRFKGEVQTLAPPASDLEQLDGVEGVGGGTSVVATRLGATLAVCINGRL